MGTRGILTAGLLAGLLAAPAGAAEVAGVGFARRLQVESQELRLHGTGLLRVGLILEGYVAALYLGDGFEGEVTPKQILGDVPRRLEIEYFWAIPAREFAKATSEGIADRTEPATFERLRSRIDRINALYEDVEPGDRYAITYLPGVGTELALNGRRLGIVEGADFSAALFSIWFGDDPLDESLLRQLLAGVGGSA